MRAVLQALREHHADVLQHLQVKQAFVENPKRFEEMHLNAEEVADGLLFDWSKNLVTPDTMRLLLELCPAAGLSEAIKGMWNGEAINNTENRAVLHVALRHPDG